MYRAVEAQDQPIFMSVRELLSGGVYEIPVYQRNYAWGAAEIEQLFDDVASYAQRHAQAAHDYHIGTVVVYRRSDSKTDKNLSAGSEPHMCWEVVDGQQRLTTLSMVVAVLQKMHPELSMPMSEMPLRFASRPASNAALQTVFVQPLHKPAVVTERSDQTSQAPNVDMSGASSVWVGRAVIADLLQAMDVSERLRFARFLLDRVKLLRVELPPFTDLNHYFECMNNRGEQLAMHEVLKARLLGALQRCKDQTGMRMFHTIWDTCAVMERSVLAGIAPALRRKLFSEDGRTLVVHGVRDLLQCFESSDGDSGNAFTLSQLIAPNAGNTVAVDVKAQQPKKAANQVSADEEDDDVQFGAVINFPNFLLQVLALLHGAAELHGPAIKQVSLNDKQLLAEFELLLDSSTAHADDHAVAENIREFAFALLRCRFLLDQCVIKRAAETSDDEEQEHWQLRRCKFKSSGNRPSNALQWVSAFDEADADTAERLRMLQSAFHVSYMLPTRKHWLQAVLRWLYKQAIHQPIDARAFLQTLEALAKAFVMEVGSGHASYEQVAHRTTDFFAPLGKHKTPLLKKMLSRLKYGQTRLFEFNFLDYLLWLQAKQGGAAWGAPWRDFAFTSSRRSVEHLHPQTELVNGDGWQGCFLHAFGNLCLVSHAMNSKLGNAVPHQKFKLLTQEPHRQSLKMLAMHACFKENGERWTVHVMRKHERAMRAVWLKALASNGAITLGSTHACV